MSSLSVRNYIEREQNRFSRIRRNTQRNVELWKRTQIKRIKSQRQRNIKHIHYYVNGNSSQHNSKTFQHTKIIFQLSYIMFYFTINLCPCIPSPSTLLVTCNFKPQSNFKYPIWIRKRETERENVAYSPGIKNIMFVFFFSVHWHSIEVCLPVYELYKCMTVQKCVCVHTCMWVFQVSSFISRTAYTWYTPSN